MFQNTPAAPGFATVSSQSFSSPFVSDNNFDNVFGQNNYGVSTMVSPMSSTTPTTDSKLVTGDLDSSLANLASNLNFGPAANRNFASAPARGPPMGTQPAGFNPFPQQQQMAAQEMFSTPATPTILSSSQPPFPDTSQTSPFPVSSQPSLSPFPVTSQTSP